jgi:hypothetical protein
MPAPEVATLYQTAVLWMNTGVVDKLGQIAVADPIEVAVRWSDSLSESTDPQGQTIMTDSTVVIGVDVTVGSLIWLGLLRDWKSTPDQDIKEVRSVKKTPDIKGRVFKRTLGLFRYRGKLPPAVPTTNDSPEWPWDQ